METMIVDILVSLLILKGIFLMLHYIKCGICCKFLADNHLWKIEFSFNSWITIHFTMNECWKKKMCFLFCRAQKSEVCIIWIQSYHLYYSNSYFLSFSYLYWNIKKNALSLWLDSPPLPSLLPSFFFFPSSFFPPSPDYLLIVEKLVVPKRHAYRSIKRNITQIRKTAEQQFYNQTK